MKGMTHPSLPRFRKTVGQTVFLIIDSETSLGERQF